MEGIALYDGEAEEKATLGHRFSGVIGNWWAIMQRTKMLNALTAGYEQVAVIFPFIVAAPRFFSGQIPLGGLTQIADAFGQVQDSLSWFVNAYGGLANWKASVDRLLTFQVAPPQSKYPAEKATAFYRTLLESLRGAPGVRGAATSSGIPFGNGNYTTTPIATTGPSPLPPDTAVPTDWRVVSPGFFHTMNIPLVRGRELEQEIVRVLGRERISRAFDVAQHQLEGSPRHVLGRYDPIAAFAPP